MVNDSNSPSVVHAHRFRPARPAATATCRLLLAISRCCRSWPVTVWARIIDLHQCHQCSATHCIKSVIAASVIIVLMLLTAMIARDSDWCGHWYITYRHRGRVYNMYDWGYDEATEWLIAPTTEWLTISYIPPQRRAVSLESIKSRRCWNIVNIARSRWLLMLVSASNTNSTQTISPGNCDTLHSHSHLPSSQLLQTLANIFSQKVVNWIFIFSGLSCPKLDGAKNFDKYK